jgi:hypothetical protein
MEQSDSPIADLSNALIRMAQTLSEIGTPLFAATASQPASPLHVFHDALARDISVCIQSLQFHDRMTQQLTQAHALLTGCAPASLRTLAQTATGHGSSTEGSVELF